MEPIMPKEPEQKQDAELEEIEQLAEMASQFLQRAAAFKADICKALFAPIGEREGRQAQPPEGTSEERTGEVD